MAVKPKPFIPSFLRSALSGSRPIQMTFADVVDSNIKSTSSFIYDPAGSPLKNSQQLNVDWSDFKNHTFFMSAEAKTNLAFEQIINGYPFDGSRMEIETFFDKLTGFDNWVFEQFPKFRGQLHFSGTQVGEDLDGTLGTWIKTKDSVGALFPELAKSATGGSVLNPKGGTSMTVEMHLFLPEVTTDGTQVIFQKLSGSTQGFSLYLEPTGSTSVVTATFALVSGGFNMTTSAELEKGVFNHFAVTLNRELGTHFLQFAKDGEIVSTSRSKYVINNMNIDNIDLIIGSGSTIDIGATSVTPTQTLSGTLDEFRLFHSARTTKQQQLFAQKSIFASDDLKLYYRFNEPLPPLTINESDSINSIVIDSSGNALHALVSNFTGSLREDATNDPLSKMIYEKLLTAPVLFPAYPDVISLNNELLTSGALYDAANPNLITRLIPRHYLEEGAVFEGFEEPEGLGNDPYGGDGLPGQGKAGGVQLLLSLLYVYARFFDEMKIFIDAFSNLRYVDYDTNETVPANFILELVNQYGFHLPPLFNDSTLEQYVHAENIDLEISNSELSLRSVQNELMRRVLINLPHILRSKGTQFAIKAFLRAIGIDPENSMRIREFGGPTSRQLSYSRESKHEPNVMVDFISSSLAVSPFLSASRIEVGTPKPEGTLVQSIFYPPHGISDSVNDGLLTSGSWTIEEIVKWTPVHVKLMTSATQSLVRLCATGSNSSEGGIIANLLAISSSVDPRLVLYVRPGVEISSSLLQMTLDLPVEGIFNGDRWNVSFGVERNDSIDSNVSSSYFLRAATQIAGNIEFFQTTSSYFYEQSEIPGDVNALRSLHVSASVSGAYLALGENQTNISGAGAGYSFLNDTSISPDESRVTSLSALISNLRFWSKALLEKEWKEHVRNYKSLGVQDPSVNYNFTHTPTGSWERVRLDVLTKQPIRTAATTGSLGEIFFLDHSLNGYHMTGSGFKYDADVLRGEIFDYSYISPNFDEASTNEKIRARSFLNQSLVDATPWASMAPVHEIVKSERPTDDVRFSIEFSLVDALNRDIITIFSTLDAIDNAIGNPELLFSPDYPDLSKLRDIYFNRLSEKLNFKGFFEFFRWFDTTIGTFIEQLVPRKTAFKGTNFVVESHVLERHKLEYYFNEIYLGESDRNRITDVLLLQQIAGTARKY